MVLDKAHTNHNSAPEEGDEGEMNAWANLSYEDCGWWLENDIWDEEDEIGNVL